MPSACSQPDRVRIREQAVDWALRLGEPETPEADRRAFQSWHDSDPAHAEAFRRARRLLGDSRLALAADPDLTRRLIRGRSAATVVAITALAGAGLAFVAADGPTRWRADLISAADEMPMLTLPDGSRVFLNAGSALAERFGGAERRIVLLRGEAFFEVRPDLARPFVVEAGAGRIRVLGTRFNVDLVGAAAEVTVVESSVAVTGSASAEMAVVTSGRRISYGGDGQLRPVETVRPGFEAPWRSGRLVFEEKPVFAIVEKIARHLPGRVLVVGSGRSERRITGSFELSDPSAALASFARSFGLRVARLGSWLTVIY